MQHEVFLNPGKLGRVSYPYVTVLQADFVEGTTKLVCPLARIVNVKRSRSRPKVTVDDVEFVLVLDLMVSIPKRAMARPVGSIAGYRGDIIDALDWLFTGI